MSQFPITVGSPFYLSSLREGADNGAVQLHAMTFRQKSAFHVGDVMGDVEILRMVLAVTDCCQLKPAYALQ